MKKPLQNILAVAGSDGLSRLLGFATNAYLARVLGTSAFGIMSIGFSALSYATLVSNPGMSVLGTRDVAARKEPPDNFAGAINSLRVVLALACSVAAAIVAWLFIHPQQAGIATFVFTLSALPLALSLDWYFQGKENLVAAAGNKVIVALVYLLMVLVTVKTDGDVVYTAIGFLVANVVAASYLFGLYRKYGGEFRFEWNVREWRKLLQQSLPLGVSSFLGQTIMNLPVLIVGAIISSRDAGLFNAAMKLIFFALMIDRVFYPMFFPIISRQRATDAIQFKRTASLALRIVLGASIPIVVAGAMFAHEAVGFVYGGDFVAAAVPFQILLLYFLFSVVNTVFMCVMIADNREREYLRIMAIATTILVMLSVIAAFFVGTNGVAASVAIGEGTMTALLFRSERKNMFAHFFTLIAPAIVSGAVMAGGLLMLDSWPLLVTLPVGFILFFAVLALLKGISKEEYVFLRERFI